MISQMHFYKFCIFLIFYMIKFKKNYANSQSVKNVENNENNQETLKDSIDKISELLRTSTSNIRPPIVVIPGLMSSRLIAWKKKRCRGPDINIQDIVWLNLQKLVETMTYDKNCWLECIKLQRNGSDPSDCKLRPDEGLGAIGELSPGNLYTPSSTSIFTNMVRYLALELSYDVNNIIGLPYDWRLSPIEMEKRDSLFTQIKYKLETAVRRHERPAIIMAHSMGNNIFMYFCEWLKSSMRGVSGGYEKWLKTHIWAYVGFAAPLLGSPGALKSVFSGHPLGLSISEMQARDMELTFSSTHMVNPRTSKTNNNNNNYEEYRKTNFKGDYEDPILTFKSASGSSNITFGIKDIENGEIFKLVGNMCRDEKLVDKYSSLHDLYIRDPLKPLTNQYERPPIRHVMMVYGVDMPSEMGYTYTIPETPPSQSVGSSTHGPLDPILEEVFVEEPCGSCDESVENCPLDNESEEEEEELIYNTRPNNLNSASNDKNNTIIGTLNNQEVQLMSQQNSNIVNVNSTENEIEIVSNKLVEQKYLIQPDDKTKDQSNESNNEESGKNIFKHIGLFRKVSSNIESVDAADSSCNDKSTCMDTYTLEPPLITESGQSLQSNSILIETSEISNIESIPTKEDIVQKKETMPVKNNKRYKRRKPKNCKTEIYAIRQTHTRGPKKRFVKYSTQSHTGDHTIPYVSLSYAHTWLLHGENTTEEHRAAIIHKSKHNWAPSKVASAVSFGTTIDPPVSIFSSTKGKTKDTTTVIEVEGIDHLEIIKNSYVQTIIFEKLLPLISDELWIDSPTGKEIDLLNEELVPLTKTWPNRWNSQTYTTQFDKFFEETFKFFQNLFKNFGL